MAGPIIPADSNILITCSAPTTAGTVPTTIRKPSLKSTFPSRRCFSVLIIEDPIIKVRPVPTANAAGTPKTNKPPVTKNPPPTPKKPPSVPTSNPSNKSKNGLTTTSAMGNSILNLWTAG